MFQTEPQKTKSSQNCKKMTIELQETGLKRLFKRTRDTYEVGQTAVIPFRNFFTIDGYSGSTFGRRTVTELPDRRILVEITARTRVPGIEAPADQHESYETTVYALENGLGEFLGSGQKKKVIWKPSPTPTQK